MKLDEFFNDPKTRDVRRPQVGVLMRRIKDQSGLTYPQLAQVLGGTEQEIKRYTNSKRIPVMSFLLNAYLEGRAHGWVPDILPGATHLLAHLRQIESEKNYEILKNVTSHNEESLQKFMNEFVSSHAVLGEIALANNAEIGIGEALGNALINALREWLPWRYNTEHIGPTFEEEIEQIKKQKSGKRVVEKVKITRQLDSFTVMEKMLLPKEGVQYEGYSAGTILEGFQCALEAFAEELHEAKIERRKYFLDVLGTPEPKNEQPEVPYTAEELIEIDLAAAEDILAHEKIDEEMNPGRGKRLGERMRKTRRKGPPEGPELRLVK